MMSITLYKIYTIERCIKRIQVVYEDKPTHLINDTKQDSIILTIQRACEASNDIAMYIVAEKRLGIPQSSRDSFDLLYNNKIISESIAKRMKSMVGFWEYSIPRLSDC